MSNLQWALVIWSGAAALWWSMAAWLLWTRQDRTLSSTPHGPLLTVFKPLPGATTAEERTALGGAVESFTAQVGPGDELLIGVDDDEAAAWQQFLDRWQRHHPSNVVRVVVQPQPTQHANLKIAWLEVLAKQARGELWLWSDADIVATPGLLGQLKQELQASGANAVTCPYCVRRAASAGAMLDAAFVNAEFLPGALLLGRHRSLTFAFGAATLFRAAEFRARVSWEELGDTIADDYALGRMLQPVALAGPLVETLALETTAAGAWRHYYRWQKTIRWCRPASYAALLAVLPLLGWGIFTAVCPANPIAWLGFGGQWVVEVAAVTVLCLAVRCRMSPGSWAALALWPPVRGLTWLAVWLPGPVTWRGARQRWSRPSAKAVGRRRNCSSLQARGLERL